VSGSNVKRAARVLQDRLGWKYQTALNRLLARKRDGASTEQAALDIIEETEVQAAAWAAGDPR
jgi:hypothetical protein